MRAVSSSINSLGKALEIAAPANDCRLLKLSGRSKQWADIVKVYRKLLEVRSQNSEFFESFKDSQNRAASPDFAVLAKRAGIDKGLALLVLRCTVLSGLKETANATGVSTEKIKLPITRALQTIVNTTDPKMELTGLAQCLSEIHECVKALEWSDQTQEWFKNPYGKRLPEANFLLSYQQICRIIPWLEGFEDILRAKSKDFFKHIDYGTDLTNLKFQLKSELDVTGKVILVLNYRPEMSLIDGEQSLQFVRYVIGYAKDGSSTNGVKNPSEIIQARSLLKRDQTLTKLNQKFKFPRPKCFASPILPALLGGVFDLDAFEKPLKLRVIKNTKLEHQPVTTVFMQLVELPKAKRSMIILPKELSWDCNARQARFLMGSSAIRTFISSGTFVGAKFGVSLLDDNQQNLKSGLAGDSVCSRWSAREAPEFKFSAVNINLNNPGQVTLWNRWAEEWVLGKSKAMPTRIRQVSLRSMMNYPGSAHFEFRGLIVLSEAKFRDKKIYMVPYKTKELGRLIIGISEDKELAFAIQGIKGNSERSIRSLDLEQHRKALNGYVKLITENMWNYFPESE